MTHIRRAEISDLDAIADLLMDDARERAAKEPKLFSLNDAPREAARDAVRAALEDSGTPIRPRWFVAENGGEIVGIAHSILLPVPPIYAGAFGPPGLIMEDCHLAPSTSEDVRKRLLTAVEDDLREAGARILLISSVPGGAWEEVCAASGYRPLTLYYVKSDLQKDGDAPGVRKATEADIPAIVSLSHTHRRILDEIDAFWEPHSHADDRFDGWMRKSLTLDDRDMVVHEGESGIEGYIIAQPVSALHLPAAHDRTRVGTIDDFFSRSFADRDTLDEDHDDATALVAVAEASFIGRGRDVALVVCPYDWQSKATLLGDLGYRIGLTWFIKNLGGAEPSGA